MTAVVTSHHNGCGFLRIYINDKLHLAFSTEKLAGIQSWTLSHTRTPATYTIEITPTEGKRIIAEYDSDGVWRDVLAEIDRAFGVSQ